MLNDLFQNSRRIKGAENSFMKQLREEYDYLLVKHGSIWLKTDYSRIMFIHKLFRKERKNLYRPLRNFTPKLFNFFARQKAFLRRGSFIHDRSVSFEILVQTVLPISQNFQRSFNDRENTLVAQMNISLSRRMDSWMI